MSTLVAAPAASALVQPLGLELKVNSATIELDEAWSPYVQGTIVCDLPTGSDRAALDLRTAALRVSLQLRRDFGDTWTVAELTALGGGSCAGLTALLAGGPAANITHALFTPWIGSVERASDIRNFDLYVRERDFDDDTKQLTLTVSSDEAQLLGDGLAAAAALNPNSTDLATIAGAVLARYGAVVHAEQTAIVAQAAATVWNPGTIAWEYLNPMLEAASLRLWCDEGRVWHLTSRESAAAGAIALSSAILTKNKDRMTLDPDVWADAVVVKYTWTDALGVNQVAYDWAGAQPAKALQVVERDATVYPGPGAAAGILSRLSGRGRVLESSADPQMAAAPGQGLSVTPPDTALLAGYLSSVTYRFPDDEMDVTTRGLVDVPPGSYLAGGNTTFAGVAITAPTLKIKDFDWSLV